MFGARKLGEKLANALKSRAMLLETGKVSITKDPTSDRIVAATLRMVADAVSEVAVDDDESPRGR